MDMLWRFLFGPRLYHIYRTERTTSHEYEANVLEKTGDTVVKSFHFFWSFSWWTSPAILSYLYYKGVLTRSGVPTIISYGSSLGLVLAVSLWIRAVGRWLNPEYAEFLLVLREAHKHFSAENKRRLSQYDFDFSAWPTEFTAHNRQSMFQLPEDHGSSNQSGIVKEFFYHMASYLAIHTFGLRFVYPGTTSLVKTLASPVLLQGRIKLIEEHKALRYKLKTADNNEISSIVIDRRNNPEFSNGNTLVICCEGNAGFYEIGCMMTPLEAGYSTVGWNHPGFTGSTGAPFPNQEQFAIDAVVQFATKRLGFSISDIILYGWSIGGYPVTWAAMNYPEVKGVVVDATFDDITPLAVARMPKSWETLVRITMKRYMNLRNADQLCRYPGPVLIIRRSRDEMITTIDPSIKSSNRGNFLLKKLLRYRYPNILKEDTLPVLTDWLSKDSSGKVCIWTEYEVDSDWCNSILRSYAEEHSGDFPMMIGDDLPLQSRKQLLLYLANRYMDEFDATHCQPLPHTYFRQPWSITNTD